LKYYKNLKITKTKKNTLKLNTQNLEGVGAKGFRIWKKIKIMLVGYYTKAIFFPKGLVP
jgi:hypothetical protein